MDRILGRVFLWAGAWGHKAQGKIWFFFKFLNQNMLVGTQKICLKVSFKHPKHNA